ncbi:phosphomannose isomerase type I [Eremomyces bilateralis CBS 781.70]|uniref:Mannose-6-phosphate isomerase n=1 Tax=Eremomyces bilateralis CBS 781.70 TaxID=1392243 RepID=A0A6G1FWA6_9PEZI|nr:phosphomannose isomerase type I [Eremomyces bilateralis CBS 781.70]KAF1810063.1 phosphomannose isomerase type I [Eremomyces bilateralis CBS 781.70]
MVESIIQLKCSCNTYSWGKKGHESLAARLCAKVPGTDFKIDDSKEYAEMWMGTYPTTPSYVLSSGENLQDLLNANKEKLIGKTVLEKYGADLPFLSKILSVAKALPLQLHPNKELASQLNKQNPEKFSDPNHKPEIAVALSDFELFVGFKPLKVISDLFRLDILKRFLPDGFKRDRFSDANLRLICSSLLKAPESVVEEVVRDLQSLSKEQLGQQAYMLDLLPRLREQYTSADNGILLALLCMNFMKLKAGEAVYVPQDSVHAYLSGDIVECMARSDNVLNTGFCPAADRDSVDVFTDTLSFSPHEADAAILATKESEKGSGKTIVYAAEFSVLCTSLKAGEAEKVKEIEGPSILWVTSGAGSLIANSEEKDLQEGGIFFIAQGVPVEFTANDKEALVAYRAYAE